MDRLKKTDEEIIKIANPIWDNLIKASNQKDYGSFTRDFSSQMLFGANDMGSLMIEENVVAEAGTVHYLTLAQIRDAISELNFTPRQRNVASDLVSPEREDFAVQANLRRDQESQQESPSTMHQIA